MPSKSGFVSIVQVLFKHQALFQEHQLQQQKEFQLKAQKIVLKLLYRVETFNNAEIFPLSELDVRYSRSRFKNLETEEMRRNLAPSRLGSQGKGGFVPPTIRRDTAGLFANSVPPVGIPKV